MALTQTQVSQLYVSLFGRASEGDGNTYWQTNGVDMVSTADTMLATDAAKTYFGDTINDNQKFIEFIYLNTLGKTYADDKVGVDYWVTQLATKSKGTVCAELITAAQATGNAGDAQDQFNNKVAVSNDAATKIPAFTTIAAFTAYIAGVDHTAASVTAAEALIVADVVPIPGQTFALTTNADLITGTANDDSITGYVGTNPISGILENTAQSVDIIDGGEGNDTFSFSLTGAGNDFGGRVANVETVKVTSYSTADYNMANSSGVKSVWNTNSIANMEFQNVGNNVDVVISNVNNAKTDVQYAATVHTGTGDSQNITVNNVTNNADVTVTGANIETVNLIVDTLASRIDLGGTALAATTTLNITGSVDLNVDDTDGVNAMAALKTVDASKFTGALTGSFINSATNMSLTTGTGDDKVSIGNLTKDDVIDLGEGADKLTIVALDATAVTVGPVLKNIETIAFGLNADNDNAIEAYSFNMSGADKLTTVQVGATTAATVTNEQQLTLTKLAATANTLVWNGGGTIVDRDLNTVSWSLATSTATTDALTVQITNQDATGALVNQTKGVQLDGTLTANKIETITIATDQLHADTSATVQDGGVTLAVTADSAQTVTIVSESYVAMTAAFAATVNKIDGSAANGGLNLANVSAAADSKTTTFTSKTLAISTGAGKDTVTALGADVHTTTVSLGAGDDTLTMHASDFGSGDATSIDTLTIDAGAGDDLIDVSASTTLAAEGTISITTGAGVDTVKIDGDQDKQTGVTIEDFTVGAGGDKIDFTASVATTTGADTKFVIETGWNIGATAKALATGLTVLIEATGVTAASLSAADIATFLSGGANDITIAAFGAEHYIVVTDGTDSALCHILGDGVNTAIVAGEVTVLGVLTGVDATSLAKMSADNFSDFLA